MTTESEKTRLSSPRTSIRKRAVRLYVLFAACIVLVLTLSSFFMARGFLEQRVLSQLSSIVAAKEDLVEHVLRNDRARVALLATRTEVKEVIQGNNTRTILNELIERMREEHVPVLGVAVFDLSGQEVSGAGLSARSKPPEQESTILYAITDDFGWQEYEIFSPVYLEGKHIGVIGVRYDARPLLDTLLSVASVGETGEVLLGAEQDGKLVILHHRFQPDGGKTLLLGDIDEQYSYGSPLAKAVKGEESLQRSEDYSGQDVYAAYRTLPSLGWGLVVKINRYEALAGTVRLAWFMAILGIVLIFGAGLIAVILAKYLTDPIMRLSRKMQKLGPENWGFRRSVYTGDEVEFLDQVATDMASRLKEIYGHLEEKVAERTQELKAQYAKDRAILESIQHGIITVGKTGVILSVNPAASLLLDMDITDLIGTKAEETIRFCKEGKTQEAQNNPIVRSLVTRKVARIDSNQHVSVLQKDESFLPVTAISAPLLDKGQLLGAVIVFQDVTEERRVDYIKSEFISLASHQLRTPLSTMNWYLELFSDEKEGLSQMQKESVREMDRASKRMSDLLDTLLHAARLEGGNIMPNIRKIDIIAFMNDVVAECRSVAKIEGVNCKSDISQEPITINTDPVLLNVIIQNLFSNAVKYSPKGGDVKITLKSDGKYIDITVKDSGMGIPANEQHRVFERLFRARNVKSIDTEGSGLGLYISKMISGVIGGELTFVSDEKNGTVFTLRLLVV
ncbi:PAS domain S-box protein [Patescibacteria group bacterium]|nr:PAS domain S-box protein [Patescibacteria group bacterium]